MLHKALEGVIMTETFPKTTVDVFALVLESGGSKSRDTLYILVVSTIPNCYQSSLDIGPRLVIYGSKLLLHTYLRKKTIMLL